jgi:hypothetical protein
VLIRHWLVALLCAGSTTAHCEPMQLTTDVPECRMPPGKVLPDKYYKLAKIYKQYRWVLKVTPTARVIGEDGLERVDGSSMFDWLMLYRLDLNNDGLCDWFVDSSAPMSTGGDRDSIDTLYLGVANGWKRIGFTVPDTKPDELGFGKSLAEQDERAVSILGHPLLLSGSDMAHGEFFQLTTSVPECRMPAVKALPDSNKSGQEVQGIPLGAQGLTCRGRHR